MGYHEKVVILVYHPTPSLHKTYIPNNMLTYHFIIFITTIFITTLFYHVVVRNLAPLNNQFCIFLQMLFLSYKINIHLRNHMYTSAIRTGFPDLVKCTIPASGGQAFYSSVELFLQPHSLWLLFIEEQCQLS